MDWFDVFEQESQPQWKEKSNGNWVFKENEYTVLATVFKNKYYGWQIIINRPEGGRLVADEGFADSDEAKDRAQDIVEGAVCTFLPFRPY